MTSGKQNGSLGFTLAETWMDVVYETQDRATKLGESYFKVLQDGQKTGYDLAFTFLRQTQELQTLSLNYLRESTRAGNETLASFMRVQDEVRQDVKDRFDKQVTEIEKVAKAAS